MLAGCHAFGALLGTVDLLLKLILLCFIFHSIDMLKLIFNAHDQEGVGSRGVTVGKG